MSCRGPVRLVRVCGCLGHADAAVRVPNGRQCAASRHDDSASWHMLHPNHNEAFDCIASRRESRNNICAPLYMALSPCDVQGATIHTSEGLLVDVLPRKTASSAALQHSYERSSNGSSPSAAPSPAAAAAASDQSSSGNGTSNGSGSSNGSGDGSSGNIGQARAPGLEEVDRVGGHVLDEVKEEQPVGH